MVGFFYSFPFFFAFTFTFKGAPPPSIGTDRRTNGAVSFSSSAFFCSLVILFGNNRNAAVAAGGKRAHLRIDFPRLVRMAAVRRHQRTDGDRTDPRQPRTHRQGKRKMSPHKSPDSPIIVSATDSGGCRATFTTFFCRGWARACCWPRAPGGAGGGGC